ncbi:STE3-domain-containing protein [Schizopora paradoxa]|uniref:STE3-domain-containing protein n=1 Tax=Schizopora paradoxa TaxID=27342 RepID=A0A0H2RHW6_9AGAM|nr:STE3-domain-containing protein [Schizopora paradoxa]
MYGIWIAAFNFQMFVNSILWHDNTRPRALVWCDIVTKLQIGVGYAVRGCSLAICIRLYRITRMRFGAVRSLKFVLLDWFLTLVMPCMFMGLWVIIQPTRFVIQQEFGCHVVSYSYVIYFIAFAPQTVMSIASAVLAVLTLRVLFVHRREVNEHLSSNATITAFQYKRLMLITCLDTISNFPVMLGGLLQDALVGSSGAANQPYVSWTNVHDGEGGTLPGTSLSTIQQTPASVWSTDKWTVLYLKWNEWIYVVQAIIFFAVVGTTPELGCFVRKMLCLSPKRPSADSSVEGGRRTMSTVVFRSSITGDRAHSTDKAARILGENRDFTGTLGTTNHSNADSLASSDSVDTPLDEGASEMKFDSFVAESSIEKSNDDSSTDLEKGV